MGAQTSAPFLLHTLQRDRKLKNDPADLLHSVAHIIGSAPLGLVRRLQARSVTKKLLNAMPNNLQISVSDPVSALGVAALTFLSTEEGQQFCKDMRGLIVKILNHIEGKVTEASSQAPKTT